MTARRRPPSALRATVLTLGLALLCASPGRASGDMCEPAWKLDPGTKTECDNIAVLAPGNDTRVNLLLLLFDRHGLPAKPQAPVTKPVLAWSEFRERFSVAMARNPADIPFGEGSRCRSDGGGAAGFQAAVEAAGGLTPEERTTLLAARAGLKPDCVAEKGPNPVPGPGMPSAAATAGGAALAGEAALPSLGSGPGRAFSTYLRGAQAFYAGRFAEAEAAFTSLKGSSDPWLADTAAYMVARAEVNRLQMGAFDQYGDFSGGTGVDQDVATLAEANLEGYLGDHPGGRYTGSARGLLRRVDWLAGRTEKLAVLYAALLAMPPAARDLDDVALAEEIDGKLLPRLTPAMTRDPILLAVMDLKSLRRGDPGPGDPAPATIDVAAQRDAFAATPALHAFLTAAVAFYRDGANARVIAGLPDDTRRRDGDDTWFSRQFLRGLALEAARDPNARGFWRELSPGATRPLARETVELALALHEERHGALKDVFAAGSQVSSPAIRAILLERGAGPELLSAQAHDPAAPGHERNVALFTLLYKDVTRGRYAEFLTEVAGVPADAAAEGEVIPGSDDEKDPRLGLFTRGRGAGDIGCPALPTTASRLQRDPGSIRDRLCLAEFVRVNGMDESLLDQPTPKGELGSVPSDFPGQPYGRAATYRAVIADRQAPAEDRAYALYRAVKCYESVGVNRCGGPTAPRAERRGWYDALKRDYPASRWAKRLSFWW